VYRGKSFIDEKVMYVIRIAMKTNIIVRDPRRSCTFYRTVT